MSDPWVTWQFSSTSSLWGTPWVPLNHHTLDSPSPGTHPDTRTDAESDWSEAGGLDVVPAARRGRCLSHSPSPANKNKEIYFNLLFLESINVWSNPDRLPAGYRQCGRFVPLSIGGRVRRGARPQDTEGWAPQRPADVLMEIKELLKSIHVMGIFSSFSQITAGGS